MKLYGVEMKDVDEYKMYKESIASARIEGFKPTKESVQLLKDFHEKRLSLSQLVKGVKEGVIRV